MTIPRKRSFAPVLSPAARAALQLYGRELSRAFKRQAEAFQAWGAEGGRKRARRLTPEQRQAIGRKAAQARWGKPRSKNRSPGA